MMLRLLALPLCLFAASVLADPSVSGVSGSVIHGGSITITGTDFGTKTHAGPMVWDDFDSKNSGDISGQAVDLHQGNLSSYSTWSGFTVGTGGTDPQRNSTTPKARSAHHVRMPFTNISYWVSALSIPYTQFTTGNELYISFYYRFTKTSAAFGRQTKAWIAYNSSANDKAYWSNAFGTCQAGNNWFTHRTEDPDLITLSPGLPAQAQDGEWGRHESYLKQSAPGSANGAWHQVVYRPTLGTPAKHVVESNNYKTRNTSSEWVDWVFGGAYYDMCNSGDTATIDVDEFIMDSQRARVEICNTSTWSARTKCEYQVATSWSTTSITATVKKGHHADTGTAWVYVVKSDGTVNSSGFEVTLTESGDSTAPVLSSPSAGTPTSTGTTNATVSTDEGNGTLYWAVVTNTGSATDAQLKAGSGGNIVAGVAGSQAVSGTGTQTVSSITGLAVGTLYQIKFLHTDAAANDSNQASVNLTTVGCASTSTCLGIRLSANDEEYFLTGAL